MRRERRPARTGAAPGTRGREEQIATALDTLPLPLEIEVLDDEGKPVLGRRVTWTAIALSYSRSARSPIRWTSPRSSWFGCHCRKSSSASRRIEVQVMIARQPGGALMPSLPALARSVAAIFLLVLTACGDSVAPKSPVENVVADDGGGQSGLTLDTLPEHLVVRVVDDAGLPLAGLPVTWSAHADAAMIIPVTPSTDASGFARAIAILGFAPGEQRFGARVPGFDEEAVFTLRAARRSGLKAVSLMRGGTASHMCAIDADGQAWCWGSNWSGELGIGERDTWPRPAAERPVPLPVKTDQRFKRLWGFYGGTCGLTTNAELWCWGNGSGSAFGNGRDEESLVPIRAALGMRFRDFDLDHPLACGVTLDSTAYCWGRGFMGDGTGQRASSEPVRVAGDGRWIDISVGDSNVCALDPGHIVQCWGVSFLVGLDENALVPVPVPGIPPLAHLTSGWGIGTAPQCGLPVAGGGLLVCWPSNGEVTSQRVGGLPVLDVEIEAQTGMARTADGRLWIWGQPPEGFDGSISDIPAALEPAGPWLDFSTSEGAYAINAADSVVYRWTGFPGFGPPVGLMPRPVPAP